MKNRSLNRRHILIGAAAALVVPGHAIGASGPAIHVLKDPGCGCCGAWIGILEQAGFTVTTEPSAGVALFKAKIARGIPENMTSCHTADIEGYVIEGHVPVADIQRLLAERPDAVGLAVPDMPYGSPGMGPEDQREAYDVYLILRDGTTTVFTSYAAA